LISFSFVLVPRLRLGTHCTRGSASPRYPKISRTRYRFHEAEFPYFITCTIVAWLPVFVNPRCVKIVLDSWRFFQEKEDLKIFGFVILDNHLHWIALGNDLSKQVGRFKSFTARKIIDELAERGYKTLLDELLYFKLRHKVDQTHQLWQEGNHPQQIQNEEMMLQKLEYMHHNPVRRGYVDDPVHWRYSSARIYAGKEGLLDVITDWR
jgi:putative transposase